MSLSINTNTAALTAHRNMLSNDTAMSESLERLSTGLRINSAADDASGMTIADSLKAQHLGIGQGIQNANDAVSMVETADGALEESINIINTIKTKAIQAASDGQTTDTRTAIQEDIDKLIEELDLIATTTSYNGQNLLDGSFTNKHIQVGAYANETASIDIASAKSTQTGHISTGTLELDSEEGGEVTLTLTSTSGEEVELETIEILQNNEAENGMGALADEINTMTYQTGISAEAVVESTTSQAVQEGSTGSDFAINGITIGSITVAAGDSDNALITAINDKSTETGITASLEENGALTLTSDDGRAISVTGTTGDVFGSDDLSTLGYITLTQSGSSQFNIDGVTSGSTEDEFTLNADLQITEDAVLGEDSTIAAGSELAAGTVVGGDIEVASVVADTQSDYELESGSTLAATSTLSEGTVLGGDVTVSGNTESGNQDTTTLSEDMLVTSGSVLAAGTVIDGDTVFASDITIDGTTYEAGDSPSGDITLDADLVLTSDMTLAENSEIAAGSTLEAGTELGADFEIGVTWDESVTTGGAYDESVAGTAAVINGGSTYTTTGDDTIGEGCILADDSELYFDSDTVYSGPTLETDSGTLETGDSIAAGTTYTLSGDQILTSDLTIDNTTNSETVTLAEGSLIIGGTSTLATDIGAGVYSDATLTDTTLTQDMTLESGSTLAGGSVLTAGSTLGDDTYISTDITTDQETELAAGSTLASSSVVGEDSVVEGSITIDTLELTEDMTLEAGSTLAAGTVLAAGTTINQTMTLDGTTVEAGSTLTEDYELQAGEEVLLTESMTLGEGSTIAADSVISIEYESAGGELSVSDQESLTLSDISVMTQEDAQIAIAIADAALSDLDEIRSGLGSVQNQLTSTIANLSVAETNIQASESTIRDVDFADETSTYSKLSLLAQTSSYALGQANASTENLLSLMQ